ncbi:hypothetical protein LLH00_05895 [bacterium]|nr:hypothetical protein [bacterium]
MDKLKDDFQKRLNEMVVQVMTGRDVKEIARAMGLSFWTLYKYIEGQDFPAHRAELLYRATGDVRVLQALVPKGVLVVPPRAGRVSNVYDAAANHARETGEAGAVLMDALRDGQISPWEAAALRREWEEAIAAGFDVMAACEAVAGGKEVQLCFA